MKVFFDGFHCTGVTLLLHLRLLRSPALWETEEDLKAVESSGYYQQQVSKLALYVMGAPNRKYFEASMEL
jgi:hypothetical protein